MFSAIKRFVTVFVFSNLIARPARTEHARRRAAQGPLVVAGLFGTASGIGQSARACADGLEQQGYQVTRLDLSPHFNQRDLDISGLAQTLPKATSGTLLLHLNAPETYTALRALRLYRPKNWRVVGCWVWEFEQIPPAWLAAVPFLSEIWAPTNFCADAFRRSVDIPVRLAPYYVAPPSHMTDSFRDSLALGADKFVVLSMADGRSSLTRKNLAGSVSAFLEAFPDNEHCALILKTRNLDVDGEGARALRDQIAGDPRIILLNQSITKTEQWALLSSCDVYLSLHRCEGFGLPIAEAMALGKPVVATAWSGNIDFTTPETAMLTPFTIVPVHDISGAYRLLREMSWAQPDIAAAADSLRQLHGNPVLRRQLGEAAKDKIEQALAGDEYGAALNDLSAV